MVVQRLVAAVRLAQAGILQGALTVDEAGAETAAIAQEVAVDLGIEAVVDPLEPAVALARHGVAAHRAAGAHRGRRLQVPLAGVVVHQGLVGEYAGGADLHQVAGEFALQHTLLVAAEVDMVVGGHGRQVSAAGVIPVVAGAAVAGDAAVHLVVDQRPEVLVAMGVFAAPVVAVPVAHHHRHVLQVAFAALGADRAVVGVVEHQRLHDSLAEVLRLVAGQGEDGAIGHRGHAAHHDAAAGILGVLVLHHRALAAGADGAHGRVPAEIGQVQAQRQAGLQQVFALSPPRSSRRRW